MQEQLIQVPYDKNDYIALWKQTSAKSLHEKNVLLTHGTFSNRKVIKGIADFLTGQGFTCWSFEWRNHGSSSKSNKAFNFETIAKVDFKLVFRHLFETEKIGNINCITHSGGGICLTISLIYYPQYFSKINSISMFGCQAFGAGKSFKNYSRIYLGKITASFLGYVPARKTGSEENEEYPLMKQWFNWNITGKFLGAKNIDYRIKMKSIPTPVLSIAGGGDQFIAPPKGCQDFLSSFENPSNKFLLFSKQNGALENYNHSRILLSRNASKEIYPSVLDWIEQHSRV